MGLCVCVCFLSVPLPLCSEQQSIHDEGSQSRGRGSGQLSKYQRRNLQQDFLLVRRAAPFRRPRNATTKNWTERWTWISWRLRARERERAEKGRRALKASRRWNLIDQDRKSQEQPGSSFVCSSFFFFFYLLFSYWKLLPSWFSTNIFPPPFSSITTGTMLPWLRVGGNNKITPRGGHSRHLFVTLVFYEMPKKTSNKINLRQCLSYGIVQTISARGSLSAERKCPELGNARKRSFGSHWGQFSFSRSVCAYRPILSPLAAAYSIRVPPSVTQSAAMESKVVENLQIPIRRRYS